MPFNQGDMERALVTSRPIVSGSIQQGDVLVDQRIIPQNVSRLFYEHRRVPDVVVNLDIETHMRRCNGKTTEFLKASTKRMRRWRSNPVNRQKEKDRRERLRQLLRKPGHARASSDISGVERTQGRTQKVKQNKASRGPFLPARVADSNGQFQTSSHQGTYCVTAHRTITISSTYIHQFFPEQASRINASGELIGATMALIESGNDNSNERLLLLPQMK